MRIRLALLLAASVLLASFLACVDPVSLDPVLRPGDADYDERCVIHHRTGETYTISAWQAQHCDPITVVTWGDGWELPAGVGAA